MSEYNVDAEFEEIEETTEKVEQEAAAEGVVDRGIVLYHNADGALSFKSIGQVNLQDMSYYKRYLDNLEQNEWDNNLNKNVGEENAGI